MHDGEQESPLTDSVGTTITVGEVVLAVRNVGLRSDMTLAALLDCADPKTHHSLSLSRCCRC